MSRILIIEDEESIAELEKDYLELSNFEVDIEADGEKGLQKALAGNYDMFILDLMLPGVDGFELCKRIREVKNVPILMVTAKKEEIDKIRGHDSPDDALVQMAFAGTLVYKLLIAHCRQLHLVISLGLASPVQIGNLLFNIPCKHSLSV